MPSMRFLQEKELRDGSGGTIKIKRPRRRRSLKAMMIRSEHMEKRSEDMVRRNKYMTKRSEQVAKRNEYMVRSNHKIINT